MAQIVEMAVDEIRPYENNPRNNEMAVDKVAESIKEFGFQNPIIVDRENVIIAGHTRWKAAQKLGLKKVPVIVAKELTEEQARAYRLADNKTGELAEWNMKALSEELEKALDGGIDMALFGFDHINAQFDEWNNSRDKFDRSREEDNEEYNEFLEKFEDKKTTDDCYTPDNIYEVVAEYVEKELGGNRKNFVRPFYPGGDYQGEIYKASDTVVDNPPFSILSEIIDFYVERNIRFFLFAPHTSTIGYVTRENVAAICTSAPITYENGAIVLTNFLTNMMGEDVAAMSEPDLRKKIEAANEENERRIRKTIPKFDYPVELVTSAKLGYLSAHGEKFIVKRSESAFTRVLDSMRGSDKAIFGGGC